MQLIEHDGKKWFRAVDVLKFFGFKPGSFWANHRLYHLKREDLEQKALVISCNQTQKYICYRVDQIEGFVDLVLQTLQKHNTKYYSEIIKTFSKDETCKIVKNLSTINPQHVEKPLRTTPYSKNIVVVKTFVKCPYCDLERSYKSASVLKCDGCNKEFIIHNKGKL